MPGLYTHERQVHTHQLISPPPLHLYTPQSIHSNPSEGGFPDEAEVRALCPNHPVGKRKVPTQQMTMIIITIEDIASQPICVMLSTNLTLKTACEE